MDKKDFVSYDLFEDIDIRVGKIIEVSAFPEAKKPAYKLRIDFGELGVKSSSAQITKLYKKEDLLNKQIVAVVNFKPKKIAGFYSECLVLGVCERENEVVLLTVDRPVKNGLKVF
ncbi:MAG: tRNA-binding protein [Deferribacterota bacterium]|nr:tRNA-binding protein [Deferribacterota bacterium]